MIEYIIKKWWKGRENEYEHLVHEDKFKFNIWGLRKYKYLRRKNELRLNML